MIEHGYADCIDYLIINRRQCIIVTLKKNPSRNTLPKKKWPSPNLNPDPNLVTRKPRNLSRRGRVEGEAGPRPTNLKKQKNRIRGRRKRARTKRKT